MLHALQPHWQSMPADACQFFYECEQCKALLRPTAGDCGVFGSFGSVKCPPVQLCAKAMLWLAQERIGNLALKDSETWSC